MINMKFSSVVSLLVALAIPTTAFFRMPCPGRLVDERADPIVNPGAVSGHVHAIAGGSGFGFNMTYQQARSSSCSSCPIKADLSNYWIPKLYYRAQNGSLISVPMVGDGSGALGGITVYYLQRPGPNNDPLHAFPEGFRMLAGDPFQRNYTGTFAAQAVSFNCLNYNGPAEPETNGLPDYNCPDGLRAQIFFPSCWDGKNLDSPNHKSHVAYPESGAYNNGACPSTHPVHMISIFYEAIFQTNQFADMWWDNKQPFVFAMGDATGYGMHGDFVNGWDVNTLQYAVDNCNNLSGNIADCLGADGKPFFDLFSNAESSMCTLPDLVNEQVSGVLGALPGCNPITYGPEYATPQSCKAAAIVDTTSKYYTDLTSTMKWEYVGCGFDSVNGRSFTGASTSDNAMTVEKCVNFCSGNGFSYAGLEYFTQCYCSNSVPAAAAPISGVVGACLSPCGGDASQMCGGPGTLSIYHNCAGSATCANANIGSIGGVSAVSPASAASSAASVVASASPTPPSTVSPAPAASSTTSTATTGIPVPVTGAAEPPASTSSVSQPLINVGVVQQLTTATNVSPGPAAAASTTSTSTGTGTSTSVPAPALTLSETAPAESSPAASSSGETTSVTEPEPPLQMCAAPYA